MKAILLIDHGSRRSEANEMMDCMANLVQAVAGPDVVVRYAHMELCEPSIPAGVQSCVSAGATELIVFPYMLSPGKHSTGDIPRMVTAAAKDFPAPRRRRRALLALLADRHRLWRRLSLSPGEWCVGRDIHCALSRRSPELHHDADVLRDRSLPSAAHRPLR